MMKCLGGGGPCDGLAAHPGGVVVLLVASCYGTEISPGWVGLSRLEYRLFQYYRLSLSTVCTLNSEIWSKDENHTWKYTSTGRPTQSTAHRKAVFIL